MKVPETTIPFVNTEIRPVDFQTWTIFYSICSFQFSTPWGFFSPPNWQLQVELKIIQVWISSLFSVLTKGTNVREMFTRNWNFGSVFMTSQPLSQHSDESLQRTRKVKRSQNWSTGKKMWLNISKSTSYQKTGFWVMRMQSKYSAKVDGEISHYFGIFNT